MKLKLLTKKKQSGFTLLESLMSLFVLTVGILGVAGMQMQGMKAGNVAKQRMIAVSFTEELMERIRANPAAVSDYGTVTPASNGCSSGAVCTATEMAADDLFVWDAGVNNALPGAPTVNVTVTPVDDVVLDPGNLGRSISIDISWADRDYTHSFNSTALINVVQP